MKINELIKELCPNGVEWKTLGEVCKLERGVVISKEYLRDNAGDYPVYSSQTENNGEFGRINTYRYDGTYVTWTTDGAYAGTVFRRSGKFNITNVCGLLDIYDKKKVDCNYLYYILSITTKTYVNAGMGNPKLMSNVMAKVSIPIPPLAIQNRIVEILDHFTNLTANLNAELNLRRKQFEHYLDVYFGENEDAMKSLTDDKGIEIKQLQDLGTLTRGRRFVRDDIRESGVPCIHYGDMYTTYGIAENKTITYLDEEKAKKLRFAEPNDVVIVGAGENDWDIGVGLAWFGQEKVVVHDACYIYKHNMNPKFVSYFLRSNNYHLQIRKYVSSGKISAISDKNLGKVFIPYYSSDKQQSIVSTLDKFTALIANIEQEIALRQKQYEYYREELLRFGG